MIPVKMMFVVTRPVRVAVSSNRMVREMRELTPSGIGFIQPFHLVGVKPGYDPEELVGVFSFLDGEVELLLGSFRYGPTPFALALKPMRGFP